MAAGSRGAVLFLPCSPVPHAGRWLGARPCPGSGDRRLCRGWERDGGPGEPPASQPAAPTCSRVGPASPPKYSRVAGLLLAPALLGALPPWCSGLWGLGDPSSAPLAPPPAGPGTGQHRALQRRPQPPSCGGSHGAGGSGSGFPAAPLPGAPSRQGGAAPRPCPGAAGRGRGRPGRAPRGGARCRGGGRGARRRP